MPISKGLLTEILIELWAAKLLPNNELPYAFMFPELVIAPDVIVPEFILIFLFPLLVIFLLN